MVDNPLFEDGVSYSVNEFPGNGSTTIRNINFAGGYLREEHVKAFTIAADGTITITPLTFIGPNQVQVSPATPTGSTLTVYRDTPKDNPTVSFTNNTIVNDANLNALAKQTVFVAAEMVDRFGVVSSIANSALSIASGASATASSALTISGTAATNAANALTVANGVASQFTTLTASIATIAPNLPNLATLAAIPSAPFGAGLLSRTSEANTRAYIGAQAAHANLDAWIVLPTAAYGLGLLNRATEAAARTYLGLSIGTNVQAQNPNLQILANFTWPDGTIPYNLGGVVGAMAVATAGEIRAGVFAPAPRLVTVAQAYNALLEVAVTETATITLDMSTGRNFTTTSTGPRTVANPINNTYGQSGRLRVVVGAGAGAWTFGNAWKWIGGAAPTVTTTNGESFVVYYDIAANGIVIASYAKLSV